MDSHTCIIENITKQELIECCNCIYKSKYNYDNCTCYTRTFNISVCQKCQENKILVNRILEEIDTSIALLSRNIKKKIDIKPILEELEELSIILRFFHRELMEKIGETIEYNVN